MRLAVLVAGHAGSIQRLGNAFIDLLPRDAEVLRAESDLIRDAACDKLAFRILKDHSYNGCKTADADVLCVIGTNGHFTCELSFMVVGDESIDA